MDNSTGNAAKKKLRKQSKTIKQRKNAETCWDKEKKATQEKITIQFEEGNKPESTGKRRKIKKISIKGKAIQTKQNIPKQRKEILPTSWVRWLEHNPTTGCKRN